MSPKQAALFWLDAGVATIPLCYRSKKPLVQWTPYKTRLPTEAQIDLWYDDNRLKNIALVTGWCGITVLDFDSIEAWAAWHIWQLQYQPQILNTYRVSSNRGVHVYYRLNEQLKGINGALYEIKTGGKLCTTPPSVHESGRIYTSLDDPANIKTVTPEQILNYSPIVFKPVVWIRSKFAPQVCRDNDLIPEIIKIPILNFFSHAIAIDAEKRFYRVNCPFHGHKDNFWIDTQHNRCGCFAGCVDRLDVIDFFAKLQGISKTMAIMELKKLL